MARCTAHEDDEDDLLREFAETAPPRGVKCVYLSRAEVLNRFPVANPAGLRGGCTARRNWQ
nr:hypothetical protein [Gemmata palustris]